MVKGFLDSHITRLKIPGIQYIAMDSDQPIFEYIGGWADISNRKTMHTNTTMMAYSQTKTITAAAILHLFENGKLNLDDSLSMYVLSNPYGAAITIRHLLSQTSGIPNPIPLKWIHMADKHEEFNEDLALSNVLEKYPKLVFEPGRKYFYSNIAYWFLGKIIETLSGQTYSSYIREHILKPLQISEDEMDFTIPNPVDHAKGYLAKYSAFNIIKGFLLKREMIGKYEGKWLQLKSHYLNGPSFGGLVGTANSFRKFLQDQLKNESVLFNERTKNLFYTQQENNAGELVEMTLGWHIGNLDGIKYFFKEGGGGGFHSEMRLYPEHKIASIIMVNKTSFNSNQFLSTLDREFVH
ncbi:serine hydrolase domain-containing protein [Chloroflexota bacterium]